jgi:hydroxyacyl-ACP dehydratase HTD2-like protein with hotdog domain
MQCAAGPGLRADLLLRSGVGLDQISTFESTEQIVEQHASTTTSSCILGSFHAVDQRCLAVMRLCVSNACRCRYRENDSMSAVTAEAAKDTIKADEAKQQVGRQ